jgi:putative ABC transport system permease protein
MAFFESLRTSWSEIVGHPLRSLLTFVGVILGTTTVIVMVTMIEGIKTMVWAGAAELGFDGVMFVSARAPQDLVERKKLVHSRGLSVRDVEVLTEGAEHIEWVAAARVRRDVVRGNGVDRRVSIYGVTPSYANVHNRTVSAGRYIDPGDQEKRRRVAVIGIDLKQTLFGSRDPLGAEIRIGGQVFRVVGVGARIGNRMVNDDFSRREMEGVIVPLSTYRTYLDGGESVSFVTVKTEDVDNLGVVKAEVERLVRRAHRGVGDFQIENVADEMVKARKEVGIQLRNWSVVLGSIAGISLLVGGIGIYSVMKISIAERLFEIGLRKAIGASDRAIVLQFLVESTTLSVLGAAVGTLLAMGITLFASQFFEAGLPLAPVGLVLGIGFAIGVGLFAGVFPSLQAARMTPVDCLRG